MGQSRPASQAILVSNGGKKEVRGSVAAAAAAIEKGNKDGQEKWTYDEVRTNTCTCVCTCIYTCIYIYIYICMYTCGQQNSERKLQ